MKFYIGMSFYLKDRGMLMSNNLNYTENNLILMVEYQEQY